MHCVRPWHAPAVAEDLHERRDGLRRGDRRSDRTRLGSERGERLGGLHLRGRVAKLEDADEPLYAKPLLAAHKAPLVPSWARELSDDVLREQSTIDPLAVFVDPADKPVDLRAILGRSPVAPRRKVRAR